MIKTGEHGFAFSEISARPFDSKKEPNTVNNHRNSAEEVG